MAFWNKKKKIERRGYSGIITNALEQAVSGDTASTRSSALETAARLYESEIASCDIQAPPGVDIRPEYLGWMIRKSLLEGEALCLIQVINDQVTIQPVADHDWRNSMAMPEQFWQARITLYGPSGNETRQVNRDQLIVHRWSFNEYSPGFGRSPASGAGSAAMLAANGEKRLNEHMSGPVAIVMTLPEGEDAADDRFESTRNSIVNAKGRSVLLETTAGGHGSRLDAPMNADYKPNHIRPEPSAELVVTARDSFFRMLAACGVPGGLVDPGADGTSQREALRRFRMMSIEPVRKSLERELRRNIDQDIKLSKDNYALDMVGRSQAIEKLVRAGVGLDIATEALGLNDG